MADVVAHLAGEKVVFNHENGEVTRQRCAWCGAVLVNECSWLVAVPVGQDRKVPTWEVGTFVDAASPDTACLRMPLEVTA